MYIWWTLYQGGMPMNDIHRWERLSNMMEKERKLLDDLLTASGELRSSLHSREWPNLEDTIKQLNHLSGRLETIEHKRHIIASKLVDNDESIEKTIAKLPEEVRSRFKFERSELKARLLTMRSRMKGIADYAASRGQLGRELMEVLVPTTRGRIYDNKGRSASAARDPLVVSRQL